MTQTTQIHLILFALVFLLFTTPGFAAETNPGDPCTASETDLFRRAGGPENPGTGYMLVCDGSQWKAVYEWDTSSSRALFQVDNDTGSCTTDKTGRLRYNSGTDTWEYCTGSAWSPFESAAGGGGNCTSYTGTVNSFSFPVAYKLTGETYTWPAQTVSGLTEDLAHACVTGDGSPSILVDSIDRSQGPFPVVDTTDIQVSAITPSTNTLTIGTNFSTVFEVREATCTTYTGSVDNFTYPQIFADFSQVVTSESRQITGLSNDYAYACVSGEGSPSIVLDGVDKGSGPVHIPENSQLQVKATTASTATTRTATLNIGQNFSTDFKFTAGCGSSGLQTFNLTKSIQTLDITSDISYCTFTITVKGAGGCGRDDCTPGGAGGGVTFDYKPAGNTGTFYILVGEGGEPDATAANNTYGGGGMSQYRGSAGGASAIRVDSTVLAVSGGGGTGYPSRPGGAGGGGNNCGDEGMPSNAYGEGGCNDTGGSKYGGSGGSDGLEDGDNTTYHGSGYSSFLISGGGAYDWNAGGGGYGGGGIDDTSSTYAGGGGGGYLNTTIVESGASVISGAGAGQDGVITIEWGP